MSGLDFPGMEELVNPRPGKALANWEKLVKKVLAADDAESGLAQTLGQGADLPSSLGNKRIDAVLAAADHVRQWSPQVARILCEHAYTLSQQLDPNSRGRGMLQFKTGLLSIISQKKSKKEGEAIDRRNDAALVLDFYKFYRNKVDQLEAAEEERHQISSRSHVAPTTEGKRREANIRQAYQTFRILNDVVDSLVPPEEKRRLIGSQQEIGRPRRNIEADAAKASEYKPYNILPLETPNADDLFVSLPQVKGAHSALRLPEGFPRLPNTVPRPTQRPADIFDLLQYIFGFQKDSVNNQREHVILMLANTHARVSQPDDGANGRAIEHLHDRVLDNYNKWCTYLRKESHCKKGNSTPVQLLLISLYFLIWGEAGNLRFLPECLCYIFHNMASEVLQQLEKAVANRARGVGDGDHEFLDQVVKPVYDVISAEAKHGKGKSHSEWRNYDDLNEYFWSDHCFSLGWPWSLDAPFFVKPESGAEGNVSRWKQKRMGKTLFVEHRTGFHIFRSFHRLWIFFLLALQGLATIAFTDKLRSVHRVKVILSLGPSFVLLRFIQSIFDVILMFGAYSSTRPQNVARVFVRFIWFLVSAVFITFLYIRLMMEANKNSTSALFNSYVLVLGVYAASQLIVSSISRISALRLQVDKIGSWGIIRFISWLQQERYYVGRGLYEKTLDFVIYSAFWVTVLVAKFTFSYFFQIKPLVAPTRAIVGTNIPEYNWHSFFSRNHHNTWTVAGIWAPVVLIYFLDTQVWYTVFSSFWGGFDGALMRLGEIRSLSMLRHRFFTFPDEFARRLVPSALSTKINTSGTPGAQFSQRERTNAQKFAHIWNEIIKNLREEDYISNKEKEFLLMPKNRGRLQLVQWPLFLLANKVPIAINMCMEHKGSQDELQEKIFKDKYMASAVQEAYASVQQMLLILVQDGPERNWVQRAFGYIDAAISDSALVHSLRLKKLGGSDGLVSKLGVLTKNLIGLEKSPDDEKDKKLSEIKKTLRKFFEIVMHDIFSDQIRDKFEPSDILEKARKTPDLLFSNIYWPSSTENHDEMVRLLHLLTSELSASNVPKNAEAQRRLEFFTNSLFMDMPETPPLQKMFSFSVLTPYYAEDVMFSYSALNEPNEDGITTLFYLQKIFPDEWKNYLERVFPPEDEDNETEEDALKRGEKELLVHIRQLKREERKKDAGAESNEDGPILQLRLWASYRGQTLARTVRGMMYYRSALVLLNQLEDPPVQDEEAARRPGLGTMAPSLRAESIADTKFSYVVSCQIYGSMKKASDRAKKQKADDIGYLLKSHEGLRVAYIHTEETTVDGKNIKAYFSKLVKADSAGEQEIYSIKLPGDPLIGEGKPENQNHAIVFTRGDAIQTIDMNQDNYFEEAVKMRNLLQEFDLQHGLRKPSILGVREHVFTGSVSSLGWFMSNQETSFVTLGQRVLAKPLKVRMHYGHPDVFDRIFHISRGGISKASKVINISEDIYAGFNSTLRQGNVTHHEYIQVGKGRDVGLNQIAIFEGKVAGGNGEQVLSRDIYRLGQLFDFFRMLSFYYTSVGFYICTMMTVLTVYVFLYGKVYLALSGVESALSEEQTNNKALQTALNTQFLFQIGIFTAVPMIMGSILERGLIRALMDFVTMQLQGASVFFTFSLGTRTHYFGRTILHGGAKYQSTGRGFVVQHISFAENYRLFSRSHFVKGFEVALLLIVYGAFGSQKGTVSYILLTFSSWFLALSWLYAPFLFNPAGFEWQKTVEDFEKWNTWMFYRGGVGVKGNESWEAWWEDELSHITSPRGRLWEIILSLRFLIFQYGVVYSLQVTGNHTSLNVYWISWLALLCLLTILKAFTFKSAKYQLLVRLCQGILLLLLTIGLVLSIVLTTLTVGDVFAISLALLPTGWAILSVSVAIKPVMKKLRLWKTVRSLARFYDAVFGLLIFIPIAALSWIPFVSTFQTRLVFNQAFSRGLEISLILSGKKDEEEKLDGGAKAKVLCASCKKCLGETKKDETKKEN